MSRLVCIGEAVNWEHSLNRGLVSWWKALPDQQRGNVFRDLCLRNHGALVNGPLWSGLSHPGGWGSLVFPLDAGAHVDLGVLPQLNDDFTISFFVKFGSVANNQTVFGGQRGTPNARMIIIDANPTPLLRLLDENVSFIGIGTTALTTAIWYHVAWTVSGTSHVLYLNAAAEITATYAFASDYTGTTNFSDPQTGRDLDGGSINNMRLYNRTLSASEVAALHLESLAGHPNTLNWQRPLVYFDMGGEAPETGRRFRYLPLLGAA